MPKIYKSVVKLSKLVQVTNSSNKLSSNKIITSPIIITPSVEVPNETQIHDLQAIEKAESIWLKLLKNAVSVKLFAQFGIHCSPTNLSMPLQLHLCKIIDGFQLKIN